MILLVMLIASDFTAQAHPHCLNLLSLSDFMINITITVPCFTAESSNTDL